MKWIIAIIIALILAGYFFHADPLCKEVKRLKETPTTYDRWLNWDEKPNCV